MPLSGYLKTSDHGRISSISITGNKEQRKKLLPTKYNTATSQTTMYVRDCVSHESEKSIGGLVPVELFDFEQGVGWVSQGMAKCCVLCWRIVVPPNDDFPEPQPLPVGKNASSDGTPRRRGQDKKPRTRPTSPVVRKAASDIKGWLDADPSLGMDVPELVTATGLPRTTLNQLLKKMVDKGYIVGELEDSGGPRKKWVYYSPEKEA